DSATVQSCTHSDQAYAAAEQLARYSNLLSGFNASTLQINIPALHKLPLRYKQSETALENGNAQRIEETHASIETLKQYRWVVDDFEAIRKNPEFRYRVTHHATKLSDVLFDSTGMAICVIALDPVMSGYFITACVD